MQWRLRFPSASRGLGPRRTASARYGSVVEDWRADRIESARQGKNPTVIARLPEAFAVMGDVQWLPGYCVLLVNRPDVDGLTDLDPEGRRAFLASMATLGEAVESACRAADSGFVASTSTFWETPMSFCTLTCGPDIPGSHPID